MCVRSFTSKHLPLTGVGSKSHWGCRILSSKEGSILGCGLPVLLVSVSHFTCCWCQYHTSRVVGVSVILLVLLVSVSHFTWCWCQCYTSCVVGVSATLHMLLVSVPHFTCCWCQCNTSHVNWFLRFSHPCHDFNCRVTPLWLEVNINMASSNTVFDPPYNYVIIDTVTKSKWACCLPANVTPFTSSLSHDDTFSICWLWTDTRRVLVIPRIHKMALSQIILFKNNTYPKPLCCSSNKIQFKLNACILST